MREVFDNEVNNPTNEVEIENECGYCGEPSERDFCNRNCYKAYQND